MGSSPGSSDLRPPTPASIPPTPIDVPSTAPDPKARVRNSRSRQRAETRERIFEMALREFREVGFAGAQIDRIAKNAGIARGTFYFHFPTKEHVMLELARRINRRGAQRLGLIVATEPDLRMLLNGIVDIMIDEFGRVSDAGLHAELLSIYVRRSDALNDPLYYAPTIGEELVGHLERISERDGLGGDLPIEELATLVMASLFGIVARVPRDRGVREACHSLVDLIVRGLASSEPRPPEPPSGSGNAP